jgi:rubrerythrin
MSTIPTAAPVIPCRENRTCRFLRLALAEKRRARQLYLDAARTLEEGSLQVIAHAFRFTAAQEAEHAAILAGLLASLGSEPAAPEDTPPLPRAPIDLLRTAAANEHAIWDERYPLYAGAAQEEGYPRIAGALRRMAETDRQHARRFVQYMEAHAGDRLFHDEQRVSWVCLACGQLHTDREPPASCPGCSGGQGYFIRTNFYPFSVEG